LLILYIWIAVDAYRVAKRTPGNSLLVMLLILAMFFVYGWQIGEINPVTVITQADEAGPALARVLWPWQRAVTYPEEVVSTSEILMAPCGGDLPAEIGPSETGVDLAIEPRCGEPSTQEQPGTTFTVQGTGFIPAEPVEFWWQDPIGNEFRQRQAGDYLRVTPDAEGNFRVELIFPYRLLPPQLGEGPKPWELQARQVASVGKAQVSAELKLTIEKMVETIMIGMMATFFGILLAVPLSFIAARNLMGGTTIGMLIYTITRTIMNIIRSIEPLIWAIIAVIVVGLGPFAGILALTLHSVAALGKLYSEAVESIDPGPIEAIQATGANWFQMVMYAVVPQIIPPFVSFTIYRWDINIRMSTIIGFVGGGGIGFLLAQWIRLLDYQAAGIAVWFIAVTVAILDYVSAEIRARFI
jgi:phosphonate transport system permease protein